MTISSGMPDNWPKHKRAKHPDRSPAGQAGNVPLPGVTYLSDLLKVIDGRRQTGHTDEDLPPPFTVPKSYSHVPHEYLAPDGFPRPKFWLHSACEHAILGVGNISGKGGVKQQAMDFYREQGVEGVPAAKPIVRKASGKETTTYDKQVTRYDDPILPFENHQRTMDIIFNTYTIITHGRGQYVDRHSNKLVFTFAFEDLEAMDPRARQDHQNDVDTIMMSMKLFKRLPTPNAQFSLERIRALSTLYQPSDFLTKCGNPIAPLSPYQSRESSPLTPLPASSPESSPLTSLPPSDAEDDGMVSTVEVKSGVTTNGALIHGRMHCFGQTFLDRLPGFGARIGSRFSDFCDVGFLIARQQLNDLRAPSMTSISKFQPLGPHDFAANFAFTLGNFYNKPHTDNDKGKVYCLWYPLDSISGKIITESEGFVIIGGWFIFPEYRVAINFGGKSAVQIAWSVEKDRAVRMSGTLAWAAPLRLLTQWRARR
ncbi:uncharacterized protein MELLADRAFT_91320 [Melampsora larici-populina 98AG31]|uniref:Tet-like 2OG-Fe(II) oxygenase domain-containing protein n=1 Tax=Melampsora larici-populina (strain 98AG31 / pathotype 3-4-7) TaxID=747676 RepID=F4RYM3_MELLP|nr:uncharacterized protein MELLADRAFT_91320 [Melampsora larici-populina 98AG31]EGG02551.1 hypothetical protein MELLADRAFT_91320 [Melampsora larici-populina 98AG31]